MDIKIKKTGYENFGRCIHITNGKLELVVALEFGIRVLHFSLAGGSNVFCLAPDVKVPVGESVWSVYGGHRVWATPEVLPKTYYPDDKPVAYEKHGNKIIVKQPLDEWSNIAKEIELDMTDNKVRVLHRITNKNDHMIEFAVWAISVMAPGGIEIIPFTATNTTPQYNRNISVWPYTDMNDTRVKWLKDYILLSQDSAAASAFKIGLGNKNGWAAYVNGKNLFVKKYRYFEGEKYPDNNVSLETYTCDYMTEIETLSPLKLVNPGESLEHVEEWSITRILDGSDLASGESIGKFLGKMEPFIGS